MQRLQRFVILFNLVACIATGHARAQQSCDPLPPPCGPTVEVYPAEAGTLAQIIAAAGSGTTVLLHDGTYDLGCGDSGCRLTFQGPGVTLRSLSGDRDAVVLDGDYRTNELISIYASSVTIADLTLQRAYDHPVHISGPVGNPIGGILLHNLRIIDPGQQAIKANPNVDGWVDDTTVECSSIELTDSGRAQIRDGCYTGGIDVHEARGWVVRRNFVSGFWCDDGLSEHGIHFWRGSRDTLVEGNVIVDCARGIGFGLGPSGEARSYPDDPYPGVGYKGHIDGIIRNNFIAASSTALLASPDGFDTGVGLEQAYGAQVVHNSVASTGAPSSSSIEWRFPNSVVDLSNNLVSHGLLERDGATASLLANLDQAPLSLFVDAAGGDLHLVPDADDAIDQAAELEPGLADEDIDGDARPYGAASDIGADEVPEPATDRLALSALAALACLARRRR